MLKTAVSSVRNGGFSFKKQHFLKLIRIFAEIRKVYHVDFQSLSYNTKNKRFLPSNDNSPENIGCMYGQNSLFVKFIHSVSSAYLFL